MAQSSQYEVLRNTETLEAWRAYSAKAHRPLIFASVFPSAFMSSMIPAITALVRRHHEILAISIFGVLMTLIVGSLVLAFLWTRAYKREHPFVPPPPKLGYGRPRMEGRNLDAQL
jgi:hypothetical protein